MAGELSVTIVEARNLRDEDSVGGTDDANVEVYVDDDYKKRTATVSDSNSPQWNETFHFRLGPNEHHLHIKVNDDDGSVSRDSNGEAKVELEPVKNAGNFDEWVKLPPLLGIRSKGEVHVRMTFRS